ncbi:MAG: outer membrane beta-barrel protein [Desulfobacula sp.]|jgi:opacity protein-like surface antigen|uniref:outer membrane beta-barrel protein n=1 Tax=Desulfobacula sp. TaxID=2593537 RepID=UPI001DE0A8FD|nr:outer membrane beta-barrel protein [Desulfobacula sp.]MBT3486308.1 outer membrane beta-barrel protein [Desulfobacula sp.]MBT3805272.1 outer membrane beta-barrel protein [Desulfobacula sp.]MBT4026119.1 outer membrane beta-barrel protein [Desulfobacula sp.]MBT4198040.1 outer membrane beta-barrel protein [Desulfobacula sp.]
MKKVLIAVMIVATSFCIIFSNVWADDLDDKKITIGTRGGIFLGDGDPTNDMTMFGVYGRYKLNKKWNIGLSVDHLFGDFEEPYQKFGITSLKVNDASMTNTIISIWGEREFMPGSRSVQKWRPYIAGGLGFGIVDGDDVQGSTSSGGQYNLRFDSGTEIVPALAGGVRYLLGSSWEIDLSLRYSYHMTDWGVTDSVSSKIGETDNYSTFGSYIGIGFRF